MSAIVSIITPSFNRADIVHETAESIFKQSYPFWEWVICDDGSTDNSMELLRSYAQIDARVKLISRSRTPKGAPTCRNQAVEASTGKYLIFLDTDDLLWERCLEQRVEAIEKEEALDFVIFPMLMFRHKPDDMKILWNIDKSDDDANRIMFGDAICQGTGTIWKKQSFVEIGMWREDLAIWQDVELHLRSLLKGLKYKKRMDLIPDIFIRISDESLSRSGYHSKAKLQSRIKVFQEIVKLSIKNNKDSSYKSGLRHMALELFVSASNGNYYEEFKGLSQFCKINDFFSFKELWVLKCYYLQRKARLHKIKTIQTYTYANLRKLDVSYEISLNKIKYEGPLFK